nr:hypothetical protein [Tanacetum cinerariifolium]
MVAILEKGKFNSDFHPMVDFIAASPIRIETMDEETHILATVADEPASPVRDDSQGEACPTNSGFIADQDRATIDKSSTLSNDSAPRVTSPVADEGSMQQIISELTALCTSLQRQHSELLAKFQAQEVEINRLKERVKLLEDKKGGKELIDEFRDEIFPGQDRPRMFFIKPESCLSFQRKRK